MCYLGVGDTYTPAHKDLCGSVGQNLMCHTEDNGCAFWFMTSTSDAPAAASYFQNDIGCELDLENHTLTIEELAKAPFQIFIGVQELGDLVMVPPRSVHQVVNSGSMTLKMSWSRMTTRSLQIALSGELDIYRRVCRKEVYRCKVLTHFAVEALGRELTRCLSLRRGASYQTPLTVDCSGY